MTTEELLAIVERRGLKIELREGRPVIVRNPADPRAVTDRLLSVLTIHRQRIIELLSKPKQTEMFKREDLNGQSL